MTAAVLDRPADGVARVTLNRPPVNALDAAAFVALGDALHALAADDGVRCVILTAAGERIFSAGTDLTEFGDAASAARVATVAVRAFERLAALPQPLVGALNGAAVGVGAMLAAQLDLLVAHRGVQFRLPEVAAGFPGGGSHVARLVPWFKLQRMVLLGEPLTAEDADRFGALAALVDGPGDVGPAALELASLVAALEPAAVRPARVILRAAGDEAALRGYRAELLALSGVLAAGRWPPGRDCTAPKTATDPS